MWRNITRNVVLTLTLAALLLPASGCRRSRGGSYTDVDVGFNFLPSFLGGGGYSESFYEETGYYDAGGYYDDGGFYDSGYYEEGYYEDGYWDDDWKAKNPGKTRR